MRTRKGRAFAGIAIGLAAFAGLASVSGVAGRGDAADAAGGAVVGSPAPPFVLAKVGGGEYSLASFGRKPIVLNVYASWCASCRREARVLVDAYREHGAAVTFVGVDEQEGESTAVAFAKQMGFPYAIALDEGQLSATYGTSKIPETVFIDSHGIVRAIRLGAMTAPDIESAIATIAPAT